MATGGAPASLDAKIAEIAHAGAAESRYLAVNAPTRQALGSAFAVAERKSVGRAFREARDAIRREGDPTWLAYTLYADPLALYEGAPP